ncbi:hypothetical protein [Pleionea sp. CnH1-48]|uniref:hypothetical protein n=1 Tax=Pleionea sp. CnH1-48 TaxID=2954494 RepID=UPI002096A67B|nr:hypothetical protein [Pleionea sp. CnH1-48]MCO7224723.1 hypothetical protein [Pleionea sp. CnH1-48]
MHKVFETSVERNYTLIVFGDELARREKYQGLNGMDAIHYYLVQKHNWLPSQVKSLSMDELHFLLTEDMHGWELPKEAVFED